MLCEKSKNVVVMKSLAYKSEKYYISKTENVQKQGQPHKKAKLAFEDIKSAITAF